jgi:hypothetical protein
MADSKRLKVMGPGDAKLGRATIMDRGLAQRHGTPYVHATVFAIDVDRLRELEQDEGVLPFGWEVWLTEAYLAHYLGEPAHVAIVEDMCLHVLELPRTEGDAAPPLGSQLPFAVYAGVAHGVLRASLGTCFHVWKKPPTDLLDELAPLRADRALQERVLSYCLDASLEPPLVGPVREALVTLLELAAGG